jgi:hypothetical protein
MQCLPVFFSRMTIVFSLHCSSVFFSPIFTSILYSNVYSYFLSNIYTYFFLQFLIGEKNTDEQWRENTMVILEKNTGKHCIKNTGQHFIKNMGYHRGK